jgi:uncharacterized protein with von Willebrand factor type A (vWA) domain
MAQDDPLSSAENGSGQAGRLATNIVFFARTLRAAGLPVGPGSALEAVRAVEVAGITNRADFRCVLHSVLVKKHEHTLLFDQAFELFWKKRGFMQKLLAMLSPRAEPMTQDRKPAPAGATRIAEAMFKRPDQEQAEPSLDLDARLTMSAQEILQKKDFAQMSADEIALAQREISHLRLSDDLRALRRYIADARGDKIDPRRSFRLSLRGGGAGIELAFRSRVEKHPPLVAICDISGSMSDYSRIFLHFLHTLTAQRRHVHTFLFGTRLSNVSRALRHKDVDEALAQCSSTVEDWSGGTRIASSLHVFNQKWSRRVLGQGAVVILFTDGLERDLSGELQHEMERLKKSCRRLIWLNPLLRYDRFEAKAQGIRAMLPYVHEFRPVHNLASMAQLCEALSGQQGTREVDPRVFLRRVA